ncbi:MAG TPA: PHB depolymerase family esterase [Candidatus Binatia bacterium]|nr:PHB depolymerase family esterase [Candidatus Binatia bacterium]
MTTPEADYRAAIAHQEEQILPFLRAFEALQEQMHLTKIKQHKQELFEKVGDLFPPLNTELEGLTPPPAMEDFHQKWREALAQLEDAYTSLLTASEFNPLVSFFQSRRAFSLGKYLLYGVRAQLPTLQQYWVLPEALPHLADLETPAAGGEAATGVMHRPATDAHGEYSLYVPENYDAARRWPLIIALHGGHGRGDDYLLTWLRPAKSKGYVVLSPKSLDRTWSIHQPGIDIRSILSIVEELFDEYAIDTGRLFATGLSDGGTFSYAIGLSCPRLFAGIAPIAGVLGPWAVPEESKQLPMFIVHGAKDFIFPVAMARAAYTAFTENGFEHVTYKELPEWGHAYTYSINETLVLPWFESLPSRSFA